MEQQQVAYKLRLAGKVTVETAIKVLAFLAKEIYNRHQYHITHQTYSGETDYYKLLATASPKMMERLATSEVHLEKLKYYLEDLGVGFAYRKEEQETILLFEAKNKDLVRNAFQRALNELTTDDKSLDSFIRTVEKKPHEKSVAEQLDFYTKHQVYKDLPAVVSKSKGSKEIKSK